MQRGSGTLVIALVLYWFVYHCRRLPGRFGPALNYRALPSAVWTLGHSFFFLFPRNRNCANRVLSCFETERHIAVLDAIADKRLGKVMDCKMVGEWTRTAKILWLCGYKNQGPDKNGTRASTEKSAKSNAPLRRMGMIRNVR
jgi:hypothetical protein